VPDATLAAIDRFFDLVDRGVDHADRVLNRGKQTAEKHRARRARRSEVIDAEATPKPSAPKSSNREAPAATTALARKPRFYIVEAITPSGDTHFVVTDGGNARTSCSTRAFAEQILQALEKAS
jgi:sRNA-binding protein